MSSCDERSFRILVSVASFRMLAFEDIFESSAAEVALGEFFEAPILRRKPECRRTNHERLPANLPKTSSVYFLTRSPMHQHALGIPIIV